MKIAKFLLEYLLAILGAAVCLVITILIWRGVSAYQSMWPAPGAYFIEIMAVCVAAAGMLLSGRALGRAAVWVTAGIVLAFSLLAAFSIGLFYLPVALLLFFAALAADRRAGQPMLGHLGFFFAGGILQAAVILGLANLLM